MKQLETYITEKLKVRISDNIPTLDMLANSTSVKEFKDLYVKLQDNIGNFTTLADISGSGLVKESDDTLYIHFPKLDDDIYSEDEYPSLLCGDWNKSIIIELEPYSGKGIVRQCLSMGFSVFNDKSWVKDTEHLSENIYYLPDELCESYKKLLDA